MLEGMCKRLHQHVCVCASVYLAKLLAWGHNCCPSRHQASRTLSPVWVQMLFAAVVSSSIKKAKGRRGMNGSANRDGHGDSRVKKNTGQEASVVPLPQVMWFYRNALRSGVKSRRSKLWGISSPQPALLLACKWDRNKCPVTSRALCPKVLSAAPPPHPHSSCFKTPTHTTPTLFSSLSYVL